ncbi:MAG TPA: DUF177 domain-containing protein [Candidatus Binataceae bacterium]|nr:DUF177 domain-containing protein [Candidatus Binataceae bacterium]
MRLRVDEITAEARRISFAEPEDEVNRRLGEGPVHEYRVGGPIAVTLSYYRAGMELFFEGELSASMVAACARCAEEFSAPSARPFRFVLAPRAGGDDGDGRLRSEDLEFSLYQGEEIDLAPLITEQLILALPSRALCREDCQGLCPRCGTNLNLYRCGCESEALDPRLAVLRALKVERS